MDFFHDYLSKIKNDKIKESTKVFYLIGISFFSLLNGINNQSYKASDSFITLISTAIIFFYVFSLLISILLSFYFNRKGDKKSLIERFYLVFVPYYLMILASSLLYYFFYYIVGKYIAIFSSLKFYYVYMTFYYFTFVLMPGYFAYCFHYINKQE